MTSIEKEVWEYVADTENQSTISKAIRKNVKYDFDDIFQDTLLKLFEKLSKNEVKFRKCQSNGGYLYSMAVGTSIDILRKNNKREEKEIPCSFDWEVAQKMKELIKEVLEGMFNPYSPNEDLLITLIDFENEYEHIIWDLSEIEIEVLALYSHTYDTFQEIADHMGISKPYTHDCYYSAINKVVNNIKN